MGPYPWGWQHRDLAGTKGSGSLAAGPLRRGGKATKNQFSRRKYCEFSSLGYVDASSLPNAFCSAVLRCARGTGCGCKSGVSLLVPYGPGQGTGAVPGGCPSRTAGAAAPPGCWGLACPLTLSAAAVPWLRQGSWGHQGSPKAPALSCGRAGSGLPSGRLCTTS